jgi:hypothetical protein
MYCTPEYGSTPWVADRHSIAQWSLVLHGAFEYECSLISGPDWVW